MVGVSRRSTQVARLFSSFTANDPRLAVDIDCEKAHSLGLPIGEVTNALPIIHCRRVRQDHSSKACPQPLPYTVSADRAACVWRFRRRQSHQP